MPRPWIERHRLAIYYLLALLIAFGVVAASAVLPGGTGVLGGLGAYIRREHLPTNLYAIVRYAVAEQPLAWLVLVFAGAPTLAALAVSRAIGPDAVRRLLGRYRPWQAPADRGRALRFYLGVIGISSAVMACLYWLGSRYGSPEAVGLRDAALGGAGPAVALSLGIGHLLDEGGTLEELGWRGFALPVLLERYGSPLRASFVLGVIWMAWHLPREVPGLLAGQPLLPFLQGQAMFLVLTIALSILATWGWLETGGSVLPAILIHGGTNVWSKALIGPVHPALSSVVDPRTVITVALALLAVVTGRLARR